MSIQIGTLLIELSANVARLQEDMNRASKTVDKAAHEIEKSWETVKTAFEAVIGFEFAKKVVEESAQAEQAANRLTVAYKLQGDQLGLTRHELDEIADSMAAATQFKDNDIKRGEAELLKFGNIYGDVFTRAMNLSADLAAFNGGDFLGSIDAIGKGLANPTEGIKGLGAAIGKLLPAQREHIKNLVEEGKGLEAQNYMLDLVQQKIGGTAQVMNTGYTQAVADATKAWDKFLESLGGLSFIKYTVVASLEAIAGALRGVSSVFAGGSFSEGVLGKQTAMAKQITDLQDQLAAVESRKGLTFTDDEGRVIGEDLRADELREKIAKLTEEYKKLYQTQAEGNKAGKPNLGLTAEQEAFLKSLRHQTASVGDGMIGGLFAKADELHLGEKTHLQIQKLGQDMQQLADETQGAKQRLEDWKKAFASVEGLREATGTLSDSTFLAMEGGNSGQRQKMQELAQQNREFYKLAKTLTESERPAYVKAFSDQQTEWSKAFDENYHALRSFGYGFKTTMADIAESSSNTAAQISNLMTDAFKGMEDALVSFVKTGKLDFKSLADSIITDLIRIQVQRSIEAPLANALGGAIGTSGAFNLFSGMFGNPSGASSYGLTSAGGVPGSKASGGPIEAGMPYWVGEQGPELVVPRSSGTVIPNGKVGGGDHYFIDARGADQAGLARLESMIQQLNGSVDSRAVAAVAQAKQRGYSGLR